MSIRRVLVLNALVAAAWMAGGMLGVALTGAESLVLVWPPAGIGLGALLVGGARLLPGVLLGAILTARMHDVPGAATAALVAGSTCAAVLGAWLLRRVVPIDGELRRTRDVLRLVIAGAVLASVPAGLGPFFALGPLARVPAPPALDAFVDCWMSNVVGVLLFTPLVLAWAARTPPAPVRTLRGARVALLAALALVACAGLLSTPEIGEPVLQLVALPLLVSVALLSDLRVSYSATIAVVFAIVAGHAAPAGATTLPVHAGELWIFSTSASLSVLVAATLAASERAARIESQARQRLRQLMDATPSAMWVGESDGRCTFVNRPYAEYLGVDPSVTHGFGYLDFLHPDDHARIAEMLARVLVAQEPVGCEARKRAADGSWRWFSITAKQLLDAAGRPEGIVASCIDIDGRHAAEEALRRRTDQLTAVNAALAHVLERNDWRGAAERLLDTTLEQTRSTVGLLAEQVPAGLALVACRGAACQLGDVARRDLPEPLAAALAGGRVTATRDAASVAAGPLAGLGPMLVLPLPTEEGIVGLLVVGGRDGGYAEADADDLRLPASAAGVVIEHMQHVRRERELVQQLAHRERLASIGTLAAGVAHEINNPVGAILLSVQAARRALEEDPTRTLAVIERIEQDARRCARITRGILRFARQERGDRQPRDLVPTIHAAIDFVRSFAERSRCALVTSLPESLPEVDSNGHEIEQVLVNLVQNAIQADARRVDITACADAESVSILVLDDGEGLDPTSGDRIFDPFFTTRQDEGGTGLGLSLSHGIVTDHGGALAVTPREGGGTRAVIVLPRAGQRDAHDAPRASAPPEPVEAD